MDFAFLGPKVNYVFLCYNKTMLKTVQQCVCNRKHLEFQLPLSRSCVIRAVKQSAKNAKVIIPDPSEISSQYSRLQYSFK